MSSDKRVWTNTVKKTFAGQPSSECFPKYLSIGGLLVAVLPFYQKAMFCETCQQFGHTKKYCHPNPKCARCSGRHTTTDCPSHNTMCSWCHTEHSTDRSKCSFFREVNNSYKDMQAGKRKTRKTQAIAAAKQAAKSVPVQSKPI